MEIQQIGVQHPKIKQVLAIQRNTAPNPRKMITVEGLWAHNLLLEHDAFIDTFLWCPEAAYGDEARKRAVELAARAHLAYQVSEKTLARISERDKPDGLFSLAQLPMWEPQDVRLGEFSLIMVADGMEIPTLLTFLWVVFMIDKGARRVPSRVSGLPQSETIKMGTACARQGYGGGCSGSSTR